MPRRYPHHQNWAMPLVRPLAYGAEPEPRAQPIPLKYVDGGADPSPHIRRQSRSETTAKAQVETTSKSPISREEFSLAFYSAKRSHTVRRRTLHFVVQRL